MNVQTYVKEIVMPRLQAVDFFDEFELELIIRDIEEAERLLRGDFLWVQFKDDEWQMCINATDIEVLAKEPNTRWYISCQAAPPVSDLDLAEELQWLNTTVWIGDADEGRAECGELLSALIAGLK